MEYNENQNTEEKTLFEKEPVVLQEESGDKKSLWYLIIAILILGLLGWYGYTAGWFAKNIEQNNPVAQENKEVDTDSKLPFESSEDVKAPIDNVTIQTSESFPVQKTLSVKGMLSDGCTYLNDEQVIRDGSTFYVNLTTRREGDMCTQALVPYERNIGLDVVGLPAGVYTVVINGKQTTFELEQDNSIDFSAGEK